MKNFGPYRGGVFLAGYLISLDSIEAMEMYIHHGVYSTKLSAPNNSWKIHHEGTFADYATMKPGDNIYFFIKRKIYGIGELVTVQEDCRFLNFPQANQPNPFDYDEISQSLLWDEAQHSVNQRWVCVFRPRPAFFTEGIDMDDVLASNPSHFRMIRAFWKVSFIKLDDDENQALMDVILRNNQKIIANTTPDCVFPSDYLNFHNQLSQRITSAYKLTTSDLLLSCANDTYLRHEMAIEAGLLYQLANQTPSTIEIFGYWDYLSHQVVASPFKPVDYMDKIDVFGYSYIKGFNRTKSKYLVAELKKDNADLVNVDQIMKYVDWIKDEYSYGDYSMINAFLVAYDYPEEVINHARTVGERKFIIGRRPARSETWANLRLIKYRYNPTNNEIVFTIV